MYVGRKEGRKDGRGEGKMGREESWKGKQKVVKENGRKNVLKEDWKETRKLFRLVHRCVSGQWS